MIIEPDDDLCVFYTSGTTGFPKGAVMTHRAAVHNVMNMGFYSAALGIINEKEPVPRDQRDQPAGLVCVPLFHVTGCNCYLHPTTTVGGKLVLMYRWDATEALKLIDAERPSTLAAVPAMSREIVLHPDFDRYDTTSLGSLGGGGSPLHPDLVDKISRKIPSGNPGTGYGLTETSGVVTMNIGAIYKGKPTTVGQPLPTVEAKVVDDGGADLPSGQPGRATDSIPHRHPGLPQQARGHRRGHNRRLAAHRRRRGHRRGRLHRHRGPGQRPGDPRG